jgi:hypothetical protein
MRVLISSVRRDLGAEWDYLRDLLRAVGHEPEPVPDLNPVERARVKEMEDEIRRLRMENEFLKKVVMAPVGATRW